MSKMNQFLAISPLPKEMWRRCLVMLGMRIFRFQSNIKMNELSFARQFMLAKAL